MGFPNTMPSEQEVTVWFSEWAKVMPKDPIFITTQGRSLPHPCFTNENTPEAVSLEWERSDDFQSRSSVLDLLPPRAVRRNDRRHCAGAEAPGAHPTVELGRSL